MTQTERIFNSVKAQSVKVSSYFAVYDRIFEPFLGREDLTVVEFGVLGGGSLQMWRELFGPRARIIGVDLNSRALIHRDKGFEILIADQEDLQQLTKLFEIVGPVDIVIDDGAHTNPACVNTLVAASPFIKHGGIHVIEDVQTSFMKSFGNPDSSSVFSMATRMAENFSRAILENPQVTSSVSILNRFRSRIRSIEFYACILVFHYRGEGEPWLAPKAVSNGKAPEGESISDLRNSKFLVERFWSIADVLSVKLGEDRLWRSSVRAIAKPIGSATGSFLILMSARRRNAKLKKQLKRQDLWW